MYIETTWYIVNGSDYQLNQWKGQISLFFPHYGTHYEHWHLFFTKTSQNYNHCGAGLPQVSAQLSTRKACRHQVAHNATHHLCIVQSTKCNPHNESQCNPPVQSTQFNAIQMVMQSRCAMHSVLCAIHTIQCNLAANAIHTIQYNATQQCNATEAAAQCNPGAMHTMQLRWK